MLRKSLKIILFLSIGFGQIIVKDNFTPTLDKNAHFTTSFGLYYTFRHYEFTETSSIKYSALTGIIYEVSQIIYNPLEPDDEFSGISLHDITYNFIGITTAYLLDKLIQKIKKKHLKPKIVTD